MLIKEIHHRVKNNLQIVASLLNLQARRLRDPGGRSAILGMRVRINALALVHRSLYEANDLEHVELGEFLKALAEPLRELLNADERQIELTMNAPVVTVDADTAVTLALFITEVVTNSYKHAFAEHTDGRVDVSVQLEGEGTVLTISDNGSGQASTHRDQQEGAGLGWALIEGFARQLGGKLEVHDGDGTTVVLHIAKLR